MFQNKNIQLGFIFLNLSLFCYNLHWYMMAPKIFTVFMMLLNVIAGVASFYTYTEIRKNEKLY